MPALILGLALVGQAEPGAFDQRRAALDRSYAGRFLALALAAEKEGQEATARRLFERILDLDGDHGIARGRLAFSRRGAGWTRSSLEEAALQGRSDRDPARVEEFRDRRRVLEEARANELARLALRTASPDERAEVLVGLLAFAPRAEEVHRALGHERIGEAWVRTELSAMARAMPRRLAAWADCRGATETRRTGETLAFAGLTPGRAILAVGDRRVASGLPRGEGASLASLTEASHRLLRLLFGDEAPRCDPSPVYFLDANQYRAFVHSRHPEHAIRTRKLRFSTYRARDCCAFRAPPQDAIDLYAHSVGFWTVEALLATSEKGTQADDDAHSWFKEGLGLLLTLELFDTARSWFTSRTESTGKAQPTLPLPEERTVRNCLRYLEGQLYDGALPSLREIWANSLNNLDRVRAIVAWSFLRFLALFDPDGFRRFPESLRAPAPGPPVERAERALAAAFGRPAEELERLWRAWLLELATS